MQGWDEQIIKIVSELDIAIEGFNAGEKLSKEEEKKLKKRMKKFLIEKEDSENAAIEKTKKMLDELYKAYERAAKQNGKVMIIQKTVEKSRQEKDKSSSQIRMMENLHKGFLKKYNDMVAEAQNIQKEQDNKRKALIEELQERIKLVQDEYEAAGKIKIQKYRENQTLKHELSKMEPQLATTQSLFEAQLKKKEIEVEISMTTLKQKIEMMNNFKNIGTETKEKIEKAEAQDIKIQPRLEILTKKQEQHKIQLARAHLIMEDYKKAIIKINGLLEKRERQAVLARQKLKKAEEGLQDMDKKLETMKKQEESHKEQIKMLLTLEQNLRKEINV